MESKCAASRYLKRILTKTRKRCRSVKHKPCGYEGRTEPVDILPVFWLPKRDTRFSTHEVPLDLMGNLPVVCMEKFGYALLEGKLGFMVDRRATLMGCFWIL